MRLNIPHKMIILGLMLTAGSLFISAPVVSAGPLVTAGGVAATPTVYKVNITKIEFFNGGWVTYFSGSCVMDIASVAAGASAGGCGAGGTLPSGTYTQMRVTMSRTFTLSGSVADDTSGAGIQPCRTGTGLGTATIVGGAVTYSNTNNGSTDGGTATEQSILIPTASDNSIATAITNAGMGIDATSLTMTINITYVIPAGEIAAASGFGVNFQVENKMEFIQTGAGSCQLINLPPLITVTTPSGSFNFEPVI